MTPVNKILFTLGITFVAFPLALAGAVAFIAVCVRIAQAWGWL